MLHLPLKLKDFGASFKSPSLSFPDSAIATSVHLEAFEPY